MNTKYSPLLLPAAFLVMASNSHATTSQNMDPYLNENTIYGAVVPQMTAGRCCADCHSHPKRVWEIKAA